MTVKVEAPSMGESISEATVASWSKQVGEFVNEDEIIAELETDKVNLEVVAPKAGVLTGIMTGEGDTVTVGQVMAEIDETASGGATAAAPAEAETPAAAPASAAETSAPAAATGGEPSPAAAKMIAENSLNAASIAGTGKDGRITKEDVMEHMAAQTLNGGTQAAPGVAAPATATAAPTAATTMGPREERVKMPRIRKSIATHLKNAQNTAALLTTWNEVDLTEIMKLRKQYQDKFVEKNEVKLGFMSFFTKACVEALKEFPALNAQIDGDDFIYKNYYNIGIAVSTDRGLMVPVLQDADQKSFADIEKGIADFGKRARTGGITPDELQGGSFSITNGGVFGSLMNMPIINYPQVAILGMNTIKERPMVVNGEVVARPMMYLSLTYDHRIVDGKESVSFLVKVKEALEDPRRLMLGL